MTSSTWVDGYMQTVNTKQGQNRIWELVASISLTLFERKDTLPPHRAQNLVWQYEQLWPQPSANFVLWQIPQVGASLFCSCCCCDSSPIFFTCSLYISNCWCNFLQKKTAKYNLTTTELEYTIFNYFTIFLTNWLIILQKYMLQ